jgi:DNA invertase Pin-like site-specific DNA recombinase
MARALLGHVGSPNDHLLAYEVARLRRRVAELEAELETLREHSTATLDIELHRLAEAATPALA